MPRQRRRHLGRLDARGGIGGEGADPDSVRLTLTDAYGLWGGLSASDSAMLERHLDDLLALFAEELAANDGPRLDVDELGLHFDLSVAMLGLALMADTPALILSRLPDAAKAAGPHDPIMLGDQVAHGFLHVFSNFLDTWERRDFGASLDRLLER